MLKSYFRRSILSEQLTSVAVSQSGATPELLIPESSYNRWFIPVPRCARVRALIL